MRKISYFSINKHGSSTREQDKVSMDVVDVPLEDITTWDKLLPHSELEALKESGISIVIPYHNSMRLANTVKSVMSSALPHEIALHLTIVCSACNSLSIDVANELVKENTSNLRLVIQNQPGKPLALNTFLRENTSAIVIQVVDDITLDKNAIGLLYLALASNEQYGAACITGAPDNLSGKSLLKQVQRIYWDNFLMNQEHSLMGRAFAFRPSVISHGFPEHIMSEDYWLEMQVREFTAGFIVVNNTFINYSNPETWNDFFKQLDRFDGSFKQLKHEYNKLFIKHFGDVKNSLAFMLSPGLTKNTTLCAIKDFIFNSKYSVIAKCSYFVIVMYQLYFLNIKNVLFPVKNAQFSRETSTLKT